MTYCTESSYNRLFYYESISAYEWVETSLDDYYLIPVADALLRSSVTAPAAIKNLPIFLDFRYAIIITIKA